MILIYRKSSLLQLLLFNCGFRTWSEFLLLSFLPQQSGSHECGGCFPGNAPSLLSPPSSSSREKRQSRPSGNCRRTSGSVSLSRLLSRMCSGEWRAPLPAEEHGAFSGSSLYFLEQESARPVGVSRTDLGRGSAKGECGQTTYCPQWKGGKKPQELLKFVLGQPGRELSALGILAPGQGGRKGYWSVLNGI